MREPARPDGQGGHKLGRNSTRKVSRRSRRCVLEGEKRMRTRIAGRERAKIFSPSLLRVILRCRPHSLKSLKEPVQWFELTASGKSHRCQFLPAVKFPGAASSCAVAVAGILVFVFSNWRRRLVAMLLISGSAKEDTTSRWLKKSTTRRSKQVFLVLMADSVSLLWPLYLYGDMARCAGAEPLSATCSRTPPHAAKSNMQRRRRRRHSLTLDEQHARRTTTVAAL